MQRTTLIFILRDWSANEKLQVVLDVNVIWVLFPPEVLILSLAL